MNRLEDQHADPTGLHQHSPQRVPDRERHDQVHLPRLLEGGRLDPVGRRQRHTGNEALLPLPREEERVSGSHRCQGCRDSAQ